MNIKGHSESALIVSAIESARASGASHEQAFREALAISVQQHPEISSHKAAEHVIGVLHRHFQGK